MGQEAKALFFCLSSSVVVCGILFIAPFQTTHAHADVRSQSKQVREADAEIAAARPGAHNNAVLQQADGARARYAAISAQATTPVVTTKTDQLSTLSAHEISAACPRHSLVRGWKSPSAGKRDQPSRYLAPFDQDYRALYQRAAINDIDAVNVSYRECLALAERLIRSDPKYVVKNHELTWCDTCKVTFSGLGPQPARLKITEGLTYLSSERLNEQDWSRAAATIRAGVELVSKVHEDYVSQAAAAYAAKGVYAQRQADQSGWGTVIGSILGSALFKNPAGSAEIGRSRLDEIARGRESALANVAAREDDMFSLPRPGEWSDDGIRVTIPIFQTSASSGPSLRDRMDYAAFGALDDRFPFAQIVKVFTASGGICTGSFVRDRIILTNRHCVVNGDGALTPPTSAMSSYYVNTIDGYKNQRVYYNVTNVIYPPGNHLVDRSADWALLETDRPSETGALGFVDPATLESSNDWRLAIAGYSSDLNAGSEITMDWGCRGYLESGKWSYGCRTWRGASGSPIIIINRKSLRSVVVGVHSASRVSAEATNKGATVGMREGAANPALFRAITRVWDRQKATVGPPLKD